MARSKEEILGTGDILCGDEDADLNAALAASQRDYGDHSNTLDEDEMFKAAMMASLLQR